MNVLARQASQYLRLWTLACVFVLTGQHLACSEVIDRLPKLGSAQAVAHIEPPEPAGALLVECLV